MSMPESQENPGYHSRLPRLVKENPSASKVRGLPACAQQAHEALMRREKKLMA